MQQSDRQCMECLYYYRLSKNTEKCLLVDFIHTAEYIVKLLLPPGSHITLVFLTHASIPNSQRKPFSWGAKYTSDPNPGFKVKSKISKTALLMDKVTVAY